jgi:putative copper export protein
MAGFLAAALTGGLGLLALEHTWPVAVRVAAEAVAFALCVRGSPMVGPPAVLAAALLSATGHAAGAGAAFADVLHVLSAAMWGGGILALLALQPPAGWRSAEARALVERFGRVAIIAFGLTALTGFLRATEQLNGVSDLWTTAYGVVLLLKVVAVAVLIVVSAAWRRGWAPSGVEAAFAVTVVLATAGLAVLPSPA